MDPEHWCRYQDFSRLKMPNFYILINDGIFCRKRSLPWVVVRWRKYPFSLFSYLSKAQVHGIYLGCFLISLNKCSSVIDFRRFADLYNFNAEPDPDFSFKSYPDPHQSDANLPVTEFSNWTADPDPTFYSNMDRDPDPDLASQNITDPWGPDQQPWIYRNFFSCLELTDRRPTRTATAKFRNITRRTPASSCSC
jgi:hypothetical protein